MKHRRKHFIGLGVILLLLCAGNLPAQTIADGIAALDLSPEEAAAAPQPGDVLTPDTRRNNPYVKAAFKLGLNRSAYSNDRYLDNIQLDVGSVSGERDIYSSAQGFGYMGGVEIEYPLNAGLSVVFAGEYAHVRFGGSGPVNEPCRRPDGTLGTGESFHQFTATLDYLRLGTSLKANFASFYVLLGLTAEHPVSTSLEREKSFGDNCVFPSTDTRLIEETGTIPDPSNLHYSFRTGLGLIYQIGKHWQFSPELILDFGSSTINKSPESDLDIYTLAVAFRYDIR